MVGVQVGSIAPDVVKRLLEKGVIANVTHGQVLRLVPPLIISKDQIDEFLRTLDCVLAEVTAQPPEANG
jgi:acetylornithine/succinyldiaminopimelate/putrescine aminotransferase